MSKKLPRVTAKKLIQALKRAGFREHRQRGSHLHMYRAADGRQVTIPVHKGRIVRIGTLRSILRDAEISVDEFRQLLK